jgi:hypothetical protein
MQLSPRKAKGFTHVKASRVLRVIKDHPVPTKGANVGGTAEQRGGGGTDTVDRFDGHSFVFCKEGDFVIEVIRADTRKVLGYSYLTGPAIQLMHYEADPKCFSDEPVKVDYLDIPKPPLTLEEVGRFVQDLMELFQEAKQTLDINLLDISTQDKTDASAALMYITQHWERVEGEESHLIGKILYPGGGIHVHLQTEEHASELCVNFFQTELLLKMVGK